MQQLYELIGKVSQSTSPVFILGESGTGKELVARCIHSTGPRREKPFTPVDCSVLTPTLIESELFGHVKGAFTGAAHNEAGPSSGRKGGDDLPQEAELDRLYSRFPAGSVGLALLLLEAGRRTRTSWGRDTPLHPRRNLIGTHE